MSIETGQSAYSLCLLLSEYPSVFEALCGELAPAQTRGESFLERREATREQRIRRLVSR